MPKTKRTRKQKMQSDKRKKVVLSYPSEKITKSVAKRQQQQTTVEESNMPEAFTLPHTAIETPSAVSNRRTAMKVSTIGYGYLTADLWKTIIVTGSIVLVQLIIYFIR